MNVFIVYAHPSDDSFTRLARDQFILGLRHGNHKYIVSDLYKMKFKTDMSEEEYLREAFYNADDSLPADVVTEQKKINNSDVIVFIYPVFWTEAPAKLVGWFNRVWTYGYAYGNRTMKTLKKALVICSAGHTLKELSEYGHLESMQTVMLGDRIHDRAEEKQFIVLDGTSRADDAVRKKNEKRHLARVYDLGRFL